MLLQSSRHINDCNQISRRSRAPGLQVAQTLYSVLLFQGLQEFEKLTKALEGVELSAEEKQSLEELQQYLHGEGSWVLGDEFLLFIGKDAKSCEVVAEGFKRPRLTNAACAH